MNGSLAFASAEQVLPHRYVLFFFVCFFSPALVLHIVVLRAQAWLTARERKDFALFAPVLEEWLALTKEACTLINPDLPIYDVRAPRPAHAGRTCPPRAACF